MRRALAFLLAFAFLAPGLRGENLSTEPVLRVETGMHTADISSLAADAESRFLVTGSRDKTVRVWDLVKGELLRTIRPPIGPDLEGTICDVAISPDGETVAVGGWTNHSVYLFERSTGLMVRRIPNLPNVVLKLAFSPDNKLLGVSLGGENGIRVFRLFDGYEIWREDYCKGVSNFSFGASERIATSCSDGHVRLYDAGFEARAVTRIKGEPTSISFSPQGHEFAVGCRSEPRIYIFPVTNLSLTYKTNPALFNWSPAVTWSKDGSTIYSKGLITQRWPQAGRGEPIRIPFGKEIAPLSEDRLAFVSAQNAWGVINASGTRLLYRESDAVDFQIADPEILTDSTGSRVFFNYYFQQPAVFSIESRRLSLENADRAWLRHPLVKMPGLNYKTTPLTLNGKPLIADASEFLLDHSVTSDAEFLLLATNQLLRYYDRTGKEHWRIRPPALAHGVTLSGDGRLAIVAFGDGTIRWFRTDDGRELLAFFPHADQKHWVAWTPSGYYDTSVGGEELLGWHVNRGPDDAADWYPASRFRARLYRPDVVARILKTRDEAKALAEADATIQRRSQTTAFTQLQPPVITLLAPAGELETREKSLPFRIVVKTPSGEPVTSIRAYIDGHPADTFRGLVFESDNPPAKSGTEKTYEISVPIPPRDCTVAIVAETRFATSEPVAVKVRWAATPPVPEKPTLYLLTVGVGAYKNPDFRLDLPAKDARDVAAAWKRQEGGLYAKVESRLLTDKEATRDAILSGLEWLENQVTQRDVAVLFFAGHGVNDPRSGGYQFLPYEADLNARRTTLLPDREVISALAGLPGKALVFLDTCYSGNLLGGLRTRDAGDLTGLINELASTDNGVVVFAASTGRQRSAESPDWKNGVFTKAVVEALNGKADLDGNRSIWITEIENYLGKRLKELTGGLQTPVYHKPGGVPDFPVAVTGRP